MNKKILISVLLIGILAFGAGIGTYAYFTSTATSTNNVFQTGTLTVASPGQIATSDLGVSNIYPTWSNTKTVTVHNSGTLDFKYRMSVTPIVGNLLYDGATPLQVRVDNGAWANMNALGYVELGQIAAGQDDTFTIDFRLPAEANNTYQGANANFTFVFDATQTTNPSYNQ